MAVIAADNLLNPLLIVEIPFNCFADPTFESLGRAPAKLALYFAYVDSVAPVMAWAICDVGDQISVAFDCGILCDWAQIIEDVTEHRDDIDIGFFIQATNVVDLTARAMFQNGANSGAVICNVKPVSDLQSVAING